MSLSTKLLIITWVLILVIGALAGGYYFGFDKGKKACESSKDNPATDVTSSNLQNQGMFPNLNESQRACLNESLGSNVLDDLEKGARLSSPEENKKIEACGVKVGTTDGVNKVIDNKTP